VDTSDQQIFRWIQIGYIRGEQNGIEISRKQKPGEDRLKEKSVVVQVTDQNRERPEWSESSADIYCELL
jgi:hypothetical protein